MTELNWMMRRSRGNGLCPASGPLGLRRLADARSVTPITATTLCMSNEKKHITQFENSDRSSENPGLVKFFSCVGFLWSVTEPVHMAAAGQKASGSRDDGGGAQTSEKPIRFEGPDLTVAKKTLTDQHP